MGTEQEFLEAFAPMGACDWRTLKEAIDKLNYYSYEEAYDKICDEVAYDTEISANALLMGNVDLIGFFYEAILNRANEDFKELTQKSLRDDFEVSVYYNFSNTSYSCEKTSELEEVVREALEDEADNNITLKDYPVLAFVLEDLDIDVKEQ